MLKSNGFSAELKSNGFIELDDKKAIDYPDEIARKLVNWGHAPTMLKVDEEDLEDYFMRLVGKPERQSG